MIPRVPPGARPSASQLGRVGRRGLFLAGLSWLPALGWVGGAAAGPLTAEEAEAFTPTTIVRSEVNAVMGALDYGGSAVERGTNTATGLALATLFLARHQSGLTAHLRPAPPPAPS